jgi:hypothetical protein
VLAKRKQNRRRIERGENGGCAKRRWRDVEEATRMIAVALSHPTNPVTRVAIYLCSRCGWLHQSRRTDGSNVVRVVERV